MTKESRATSIKNWPEDDRPREKLLKKGAGALSNSELLAILLRTGTHGTSAIDLARKVLNKFGTFRNMTHTDSRDWKEFKGLGGAKIAHIQAALEIGRRYRQEKEPLGSTVQFSALRMRNTRKAVFQISYSIKDYYSNNVSSTKL